MASDQSVEPFEMLQEIPSHDQFNKMASGKKSWQDLRMCVQKRRRLATSLMNRVPNNFTFHHMDTQFGNSTRLYFLGVEAGKKENALMYVNLPSHNSSDIYGHNLYPSEWEPLFQTTPHHNKFSKEEQLLRERKRLGSFGITSYDYHEPSGKFVFPARGSLFQCVDRPTQESNSLSISVSCICFTMSGIS